MDSAFFLEAVVNEAWLVMASGSSSSDHILARNEAGDEKFE